MILDSKTDQTGGGGDAKLAHDIFPVGSNGLGADKEIFGYFRAAFSLRDQAQDLNFPTGKVVFNKKSFIENGWQFRIRHVFGVKLEVFTDMDLASGNIFESFDQLLETAGFEDIT